MQLVGGGDGGQDGGAAGGEERGGEHERGAETVEQPGSPLVDGQNEGERYHGADEIAGDHDAAAVEPVEEDAGERAGHHGGDGTREKGTRDDHTGARCLHDQGEHGDIIEVVANLADHLPHPGVTVAGIAAEQLQEGGHRNFIICWKGGGTSCSGACADDGGDWSAVRDIYLEGIATGDATFETAAPEWDRWDAGHLPHCRLVARSQGEVLGWAALSAVSARRCTPGWPR